MGRPRRAGALALELLGVHVTNRIPALLLSVAVVVSIAVSPTMAGPAPHPRTFEECHPFLTEPQFGGHVPAGEEVLGFSFGDREVTVGESNQYLDAVDDATHRVVTGTMAKSWQSRPLRYAIVGSRENLTRESLRDIRRATRRLRNPATTPEETRDIARTTPAILWITANVHGDEESGTDAALRTLYELAARNDCAANRIRRNAVVVFVPTQNPDGRAANTRRNAYCFDMNRDWFARTQPETDGKVKLMRRYPPVLFIDAHEQGGDGFFFPPNPDPIYHEITNETLGWINNIYGAAMADEFNRQGIPFFSGEIYDLFYMGYGDTVPITGFTAAGMTFEKANAAPIAERTYEHYVTQWTSLSAGALRKRRILSEYHHAYAEAYRQGLRGELEPNELFDPDNDVTNPVPERRVRHYFLLDKQSKKREVHSIVRRLQRMGVKVYRLSEATEVAGYTPYARNRSPRTLPKGTYWVPMAQRQKHWIQAMLNEDTYVPFPYFYDVTAWSQPLLFNLPGGYTGA
ncbi:MAG: carboxypeptidase, partial [Actinobacteria bacterium]|nr:carboxypeptidase [Actinomycetota bacterium]